MSYCFSSIIVLFFNFLHLMRCLDSPGMLRGGGQSDGFSLAHTQGEKFPWEKIRRDSRMSIGTR